MRKKIGGWAFALLLAAMGGVAFWVVNTSVRLLGLHPVIAFAAAFVGLALVFFVPAAAIWLAARYKKAILAALWLEPKELVRYILRGLPGFTLKTSWMFIKFVVGLTALTAVAVGYAFAGFALLPKIYALRGIIVGGTPSLSKIQAIAFVAGVTFPAAVTIAITRWFWRTLVAFRRRHSEQPKPAAPVPHAPHPIPANVRPRVRIRVPAMPKFPGRARFRANRGFLVFALILALFEAFVLGLRGAELAVALGLIAVLAAVFMPLYRRLHRS